MQISLSRASDIPLTQQLAEQIVFLITSGKLRQGEPLPSVRAIARRLKIHHNTVSEAYQDLVRRQWLTRSPGRRLVVGARSGKKTPVSDIDDLLNETIRRATDLGFSLQDLTTRVRERLLAQPADHILVVEEENGLREIIRREVQQKLGRTTEGCTPEQFAQDPSLAVGAQVFAPGHVIRDLEASVPKNRPAVPIVYSGVEEYVTLIRRSKKPSIIAAVSISESLLRTSSTLFAADIGRRHTFLKCLWSPSAPSVSDHFDLAICDSVTLSVVKCRKKIHYRLIALNCLENLVAAIGST